MNEFVSKYNRGDRFFIHNKLDISKLGEDYVTRDNTSYLEMMYFVC